MYTHTYAGFQNGNPGGISSCSIFFEHTRSRQNEKTLAWVLGLHGVGIILACHRPFSDVLEPIDGPNNPIIFRQDFQREILPLRSALGQNDRRTSAKLQKLATLFIGGGREGL